MVVQSDNATEPYARPNVRVAEAGVDGGGGAEGLGLGAGGGACVHGDHGRA